MIYAFAHPYMLLLLIVLAVFLLRAWLKPDPAVAVPSLKPFQIAAAKTGKKINFRKLIPFLFYLLGGIALILALAGPREGMEQIRRRAEGIDIIIALDLSGSMRAIDVPSGIQTESQLSSALSSGMVKDRLGTAKTEIAKFIQARPNDRIGLVAFAPLPYMVCPPTLDHPWLLANLNRLETGVIGDQTGIAGPITTAVRRLKDSDSKRRVIVLFTDGVNNVNAKVTPRQAAKLADTFNVTVYTVGIGSPNAVVKQDSFFGSGFVQVRDEFDEELLKDIASSTGGVYYKADDGDSMRKAMEQIDKLEKTSVEQSILVNWKEFYPLLCWLAIGFLLAGMLLEKTILLRVP
ncbi:MAG: VWA domain-containing protein [Lentisphaeria bacterium]|nr:VWA domain-containing protein [Lentisphaeria bacterium]